MVGQVHSEPTDDTLSALRAPLRRNRIYEDVMMRIQGLIAEGHLRPGDRLPSERELSTALGISRGSVRQALRVLEQMGLVDARVGGGTYVRTPDPQALVQPIALVLSQHPQTLQQLFEVRQILEPALAQQAAERAPAADRTALGAILDRQALCVARNEDIKQTDIDFHYTINASTGNEVALRLVDVLNDLLRGGAPDIGREVDGSIWLAEHRRVYAAIMDGDGPAAAVAMHAHLEHITRLAPLDARLRQP